MVSLLPVSHNYLWMRDTPRSKVLDDRSIEENLKDTGRPKKADGNLITKEYRPSSVAGVIIFRASVPGVVVSRVP